MTVSEVIEELKKYPAHLPVRAFMSCVYFADEAGETEIHPTDAEAQEVTTVTWRGHDVCMDCNGMCA